MWVLVFHRNQNKLVHVFLLMLRFVINPHKCRVHQIRFTLVKKWAMRAIISVQRHWRNLQVWPYTWYRSGENHCVSQNCHGEYFSWVVIATTIQLKKYLLYFIHIVIIVEFRYSFFCTSVYHPTPGTHPIVEDVAVCATNDIQKYKMENNKMFWKLHPCKHYHLLYRHSG